MINCLRIKWIFRAAITALFALLAASSFGQCPPPQKVGSNYQFKAAGADSAQRIPNSRAFAHCWVTPGSLMYDSVVGRYFKWNSTAWVPMIDADNGLSDSADVIQLGVDTSVNVHTSELLSFRMIEMNAKFLRFVDSVKQSNGSFLSIMDTLTGEGTTGVTPLHIRQGQQGGGYFAAYDPQNYPQLYPTARVPGGLQIAGRASFGYDMAFNGLGTEGAPDNVYNFFQYNESFTNGQADPRDGAFRFGAETNFINSVQGVQWGFEFHIPEVIDYNGHITRLQSIYTNKSNGAAHAVDYLVDREMHTAWSGPDYVYMDLGAAGGTGLNGGEIDFFGNNPGGGECGTMIWNDPGSSSRFQIQGRSGNLNFQEIGGVDLNMQLLTAGHVLLNQATTGVPSTSVTVIGSDPTEPGYSNSQLEVISKSKGFGPPKMTTVQKLAIPVTSFDAGLMVYDTTLNRISYYNGTIWLNL